MDLPLIPGSLPPGWCPTSEQERYNKYFALGIAQLALGTGYTIKVDATPPTAEERVNTLWLKLIGGSVERLYRYENGYWAAKHPIAKGSYERRLFVGTPAQVWSHDGGSGDDPAALAPSDYDGAMWEIDTAFDFKVPLGVGTNATTYDGNPATAIALGGTLGEERHTLTNGEMPAHVHTFDDDQFGRWEADGNDADQDEGLIGSVVGGAGAYKPSTDSTGGGTSHQNMPPCYGVYFIKRTARTHYTSNDP